MSHLGLMVDAFRRALPVALALGWSIAPCGCGGSSNADDAAPGDASQGGGERDSPMVIDGPDAHAESPVDRGGEGGVGGEGGATDVAADTCLPGATEADCALCKYGLDKCTQACPKADCAPYPPPSECAAYCAGKTCCKCGQFTSAEYWWRPTTVKCGTMCEAWRKEWHVLFDAVSLTSCVADADCEWVGSPGTCDCAPSIDFCGRAANAKAYGASAGPGLETKYKAECAKAGGACDCGRHDFACVGGTCVSTKEYCCFCPG